MADVQFKPFSITGNPAGGNSLVITSLTNLKKIFGDAVTTMNSGAVVMNGDGGTTDAHFQNATWQNNRLYATFNASMNKNIRVTGLIYYIGVFLSVGILMVIGIKYITGSIEEKAQYKETMVPYFIGAILLFGGINILKIIYNLVTKVI